MRYGDIIWALLILLLLAIMGLCILAMHVDTQRKTAEATVQSQMLELSRQDATIDAFTYAENCENAKASLAYLRAQLKTIEKDKEVTP